MIYDDTEPRMLQIRFNPGGRWYKLHPAEHDLEKFLTREHGSATVKLHFLLVRGSYADVLDYYPVGDES